MEIIALGSITEGNQKSVVSMMEGYYRLMHPGTAEESAYEKDAKQILAEESKKVFAIRPAMDPKTAVKEMSKDPRALSLGSHFLKNQKIYNHRDTMNKAIRVKK